MTIKRLSTGFGSKVILNPIIDSKVIIILRNEKDQIKLEIRRRYTEQHRSVEYIVETEHTPSPLLTYLNTPSFIPSPSSDNF